jgi:hypothetical protein
MTSSGDPGQTPSGGSLDEQVDVTLPSPARIYDFWLGGHHNFDSDREVGRRAMEQVPSLRPAIWANRAFLRRMVRYLAADLGVRQFLDLGSGVPTVGNVHEIAQRVDATSRVVYVDVDPVAVAHSRQILGADANTAVIHADLRDSDDVVGNEATRRLLDPRQPTAVLMNAVLHFVPDSDEPAGIVRGYVDWLPDGGYLAISHGMPDPRHITAQSTAADDYQQATKVPFVPRSIETITSWVDGLELEPPGVVPINLWHPDPGDDTAPVTPMAGLVARKPLG